MARNNDFPEEDTSAGLWRSEMPHYLLQVTKEVICVFKAFCGCKPFLLILYIEKVTEN